MDGSEKSRGRPRNFDEAKVLDQAMCLFWRQGYEGTSYADLTAGTGLNKPSLYAAFGDKEALFLKAMEHYDSSRTLVLQQRFVEEPDFARALRDLLDGYVQLYAGDKSIGGCFMATALADSGAPDFPPAITAKLKVTISAAEDRIVARMQQAQTAGDLPAGMTAAAAAQFVTVFILGIASAARGGMAGQGGGALLPSIQAVMRVFGRA